MIDGLDAVRLDDLAHAILVVHAAEQRRDLEVAVLRGGDVPQLAVDVVERQLRHLEQQDAARTEARDLPAQLRADRTAGAGDHHDLVADARVEQPQIGRHRLAAEQVARIDVTNVLDARLADDDVADVRHGLDVHAQRLERGQDLAASPVVHRRHGEQYASDGENIDEVRQLVRRVHLDPVDHAAPQCAVVVDETDRQEITPGEQARRQTRTRLARTEDGDPLGLARPLDQQLSCKEPAAAHVQQRQRPVDCQRGERQCLLEQQLVDHREHQHGCRHAREHGRRRARAEEADDGPVEAESCEDRDADGRGRRCRARGSCRSLRTRARA